MGVLAMTYTRLPRNPREELLCRLFAEVLGVPEVGADDSFFDLGGDSIISMQLVSKARQAGLEFDRRAVFVHKSAAGLAAVARETASGAGTAVPAESASGRPGANVPLLELTPDEIDDIEQQISPM